MFSIKKPAKTIKPKKTMVLQEYKLYAPIKAWLEAQDFEVFPEVQKQWSARMLDIVGKKGDTLFLIEMKICATKSLLKQCRDSQIDSEFVFAAIRATPKPETIEKFKASGIGMLLVSESVQIICQPVKRTEIIEGSRKGLISRLHKRPDDFVAGLPCLAGQGPAQDCERRVVEYKAANPKATWKQIFEAVPNHYCSVSSMQSAMLKTKDRKQVKERNQNATSA